MSNEQQPQSGQEHGEEQRPRPSIYVASLSDYNAGRLHGAWIDAGQPAEELQAAISEMLAASPERGAEEWAIHDYEGFGGVRLSEFESIEHVAQLAHGIAEHGPAFAAWAVYVGSEGWGDLERFEDCYLGHYDSLSDYADDLLDGCGVLSAVEEAAGSFEPYVRVDTEAFGSDLVLGGDVIAVDDPKGGIFLFGP